MSTTALVIGVDAARASLSELGDYDENPVILFRAGRLPHPFTD